MGRTRASWSAHHVLMQSGSIHPGGGLIMRKTHIFTWVLYDFANSITLVVFNLYYSQWLVVDRGLPDFAFNMIYVVSSALLLFTAPILGLRADRRGSRLAYLKRVTWCTYGFFLAASILPLCGPTMPLWPAVICYVMANYTYLLSIVFYTPLLRDISVPERRGFVSGLGLVGNWLGQVAGILACLPFLSGAPLLPGGPGRVQTFLPATLMYATLSLPMMLFFRLPPASKPPEAEGGSGLRGFAAKCAGLLKVRGMAPFLIAYFLFSDALLTISINFPIFLNQVWRMPDKTKSLLMLMILATSAVGSAASGWLGDRYGLRRVLIGVLFAFCLLLPAVATRTDARSFTVSIVILSAFFGAVFTVSRALLTRLCPAEKLNFASSFYVLFERLATFLGPVVWGAVVSGFYRLGPVRYRLAFGTMTIFVLAGALLALKVPKQIPPSA